MLLDLCIDIKRLPGQPAQTVTHLVAVHTVVVLQGKGLGQRDAH